MNSINDILKLNAKVDPLKFLGLLFNIGERIKRGESQSLSIRECKNWGFQEQAEVLPYLFLLVEAGVLEKHLQVYDENDDAFEDYSDNVNLESIPDDQIKLWFRPALKSEDFSRFFQCAPDTHSVKGANNETFTDSTDNNFLPGLKTIINVNGGTVYTGEHTTVTQNKINTGNVTNSNIAGDANRVKVSYTENNPKAAEPWDYSLWLMLLGIFVLIGFAVFSILGYALDKSVISLVRLAISICVTPYLGTMAGKAAFSFKPTSGDLPFSFKATGGLAVFLIILYTLHFLNIPCA
ncbi:MAG TPA: hypothetical protein DET40_18445 [Lentisphaeria bacterium]|nr:MAG: hypothetical protein A2X45_14585 [Lentisphaerae bacterium GWF2_50_93]HCE45524.1 hypothetical protein [Lentisphaeria bacterium]